MKDSTFFPQVELLLRVLPLVAEEKMFALKGGTAINLFIRDMPRLSVDIDLTYLPLKGREESIQEIGTAIKRIKQRIETTIEGAKVIPVNVSGTTAPTGLTVQFQGAQIKVEVNFVIRGSVFPVISSELCATAQKKFGSFITLNTLSKADLYGGKICAGLDRQHPRDFFDVKMLLESDGIVDDVKTAFVIYLASHSRPMNELLNPTWKDISKTFESDFEGMAVKPVTINELLAARDSMLKAIRALMTDQDKQFLISVKSGEPIWSLINTSGIEKLPGLQWKVSNARKMTSEKRELALKKLKAALDLN